VAWELDPVAASRAREVGDTSFEKEAWLSATLLEWGSCGRLVYVDDNPAGFAMYAPPAFVPRSVAFPTSPVSADAVLLMSLMIEPKYREIGLARMLIQAAAKDLTRRNVRALEAFALNVDADPVQEGDRGDCLLPADMLLAVGFKTVRPHHRFPRLRLELKNAVSWREDVEAALERILGTVRAPALSSSAHDSNW